MRKLAVLIVLAASFILSGCHRTVLREANVYKAEMQWFAQAATQQADALETFVREHCACNDEGTAFVEPDCQKAAKLLLTSRVRAPWHRDMALYNADMLDERPPQEPPAIPNPGTLCPQGGE